jgi:hypothetical protein
MRAVWNAAAFSAIPFAKSARGTRCATSDWRVGKSTVSTSPFSSAIAKMYS